MAIVSGVPNFRIFTVIFLKVATAALVIPNTYMKIYQNCIINEITSAMTKGEHTYICVGQTIYPSTILLCVEIIN